MRTQDSATSPSSLVVLGAPRSGTTLVYRALCLHPDAAWISNWQRRLPALTASAVLVRIPRRLPGARRDAWFPEGNAYVYGRPRRLTERAFPAPVEGEPVFRHWGLADPAAGAHRDDAGTRRRVRSLTRWAGSPVFVTKRIDHNRRIPALDRALPSPRFVVVQRDGRAVAASLARVDWWDEADLWWYGGTPADWRAEGRDPWEACARHWVEEVRAIEHGLATVDPRHVRRVDYDAVIGQPAEALHEIAGFGGLDSSVGYWEAALDGLAVGAGRARATPALDPAARSTVETVAASELSRLGYA